MAPALNSAVPQKIERQRANRPLGLVIESILVRQRFIVGPVSLCTVARTLRSRRAVKATCGDRDLHSGDKKDRGFHAPLQELPKAAIF
jgi:hypothetical protein